MCATKLCYGFVFIALDLVCGEMFMVDSPVENFRETRTDESLFTNALSSMHCAMLCLKLLGKCGTFEFDESTYHCKGYVAVEDKTPRSSVGMTDVTAVYREALICKQSPGFKLLVDDNVRICIRVEKSRIVWDDARQECNQISDGLFEPVNQFISALMHRYLAFHELKGEYAIGLHDPYSNKLHVYQWVRSAEPALFTNWCTESCGIPQPDRIPGVEPVVILKYMYATATYEWWNKPTTSMFHYICEKTLT